MNSVNSTEGVDPAVAVQTPRVKLLDSAVVPKLGRQLGRFEVPSVIAIFTVEAWKPR